MVDLLVSGGIAFLCVMFANAVTWNAWDWAPPLWIQALAWALVTTVFYLMFGAVKQWR